MSKRICLAFALTERKVNRTLREKYKSYVTKPHGAATLKCEVYPSFYLKALQGFHNNLFHRHCAKLVRFLDGLQTFRPREA